MEGESKPEFTVFYCETLKKYRRKELALQGEEKEKEKEKRTPPMSSQKEMKVGKTVYDKTEVSCDLACQAAVRHAYLKHGSEVRRQRAAKIRAEKAQRAAELEAKTALLSTERKRSRCEEKWKKLEQFRSEQCDIRREFFIACKTIAKESREALQEAHSAYAEEMQAICEALEKKWKIYNTIPFRTRGSFHPRLEETEQAQRAAEDKYEKARKAIKEKKEKKMVEAKKAFNRLFDVEKEEQKYCKELKDELKALDSELEERRKLEVKLEMDKEEKPDTHIADYDKGLSLKENQMIRRMNADVYEHNLRVWEERLQEERARLEEKARAVREAWEKWRAEELRARDRKREKIEKEERAWEESRRAYLEELREMRVALAKKREEKQEAACRRREEIRLEALEQIRERQLEAERLKEKKRQAILRRQRENELMLVKQKQIQEEYDAQRKVHEAERKAIQNRLEDQLALARMHEQEQRATTTTQQKWNHIKSIVKNKSKGMAKWRNLRIAVLLGGGRGKALLAKKVQEPQNKARARWRRVRAAVRFGVFRQRNAPQPTKGD